MVLLFLGLLSQPAVGEDRVTRLWDFAGRLYQEQDYYRAATEYQRFLFLFPNHPRAAAAELQIGRCYRHLGKLEQAFGRLLSLFRREAAGSVGPQALLEMVAIREQQGHYQRAIYWARRFLDRYPDYPGIDSISERLAWLQIKAGQYPQAIVTLERIPADSKLYHRAESLKRALRQRPRMRGKSPRLAGVLAALLPGAGHLYVGHPGQALASFLLNGLFIGGAVAAFEHDSPILGGIVAFFELGWYQGGIRSAATAARRAKEEQERRYRQELERRYRLCFGLAPAAGGIRMSLELQF